MSSLCACHGEPVCPSLVCVPAELVEALREALGGSFAEMDPGTLRRMYGDVGAAAFALVDATPAAPPSEPRPIAKQDQTLTITSYEQDDPTVGTWVRQGNGDDSDVETGRCCPHCRTGLTDHNRAVYDAAWSMYKRHDGPTSISDEAEAAWQTWAANDDPIGVDYDDMRKGAFLAGFRAARGEEA